MISFSKIAAGLAFGLVLIGTLPAQAANHTGSQARAQASEQSTGIEFRVSSKRARALRECTFPNTPMGTRNCSSIGPAWPDTGRLSEVGSGQAAEALNRLRRARRPRLTTPHNA
jgi:hypothetical protein